MKVHTDPESFSVTNWNRKGIQQIPFISINSRIPDRNIIISGP